MVSIVLPTYNGERFLDQSINSILNQTYQEIELIIVNDCSKDGTKKIIEKFQKMDNRIHVIHNKENKKLPQSLNIGFAACRGEYLSWTSDDNLYHREAIEKMLEQLSDSADFVYAGMEYIDETGNKLEIKGNIGGELWYENTIGACFLYRKKVFDEMGGYDPLFFLVEDYEYWLRIAKRYRISYLDRPLYFYRVHSESLSSQKKLEITKKRIELLEHVIKDPEIISTNRDKLLVQLIQNYYYIGEQKKLKHGINYLKKNNRVEYEKISVSAKLNYYIEKNLIEQIKKIKK